MMMKQDDGFVNVLLVEDNPEMAARIARTLQEGDYHTTLALNGVDALALASQELFSLVLADFCLSGEMDSYQLCQMLKNHQPLLPVMLFNSHEQVQDAMRGLDVGADDYVSQPFSNGELVARVRAILRTYETEQLLTKYSECLHSIGKIGQAITSILDLESLVWKAITLSLEYLDLSYFGVGLVQDSEIFWEFGFRDETGAATKRSARTELTLPNRHNQGSRLSLSSTAVAVREAARHLITTHLSRFSPRVIVPIIHGNIVIGALFAGNGRVDPVSSEERLLFGALAEQLAVAVVNARLVTTERSGSYVAETLLQVTRLLVGLHSLDEVCQTVVGAMRQISGVLRSVVGFWEKENDALVVKHLFVDSDETRQLMLNLSAKCQSDLLEALDKTNDSFLLQHSRSKANSLNELFIRSDSAEILVVPVWRDEQTRGVMLLYAKSWHRFSVHDRALASGIAFQLSKSIENARYFTCLQEERAKLETVLLNMQNGVFIVDAKDYVAYCNPRLAQIIRGDVQSLVDLSYRTLFQQVIVHSGNPEKTRRDLEAALSQLSALPTVEVTLVDSKPLNIQFQFFPIDGQMADHYGWGCVVRDITSERERLMDTSNLLSGISHELRSPLAAIKGFVSMLLDSQPYGNEERRQVFLNSINQSANQLGRLIDHMLEILRLDAGIARLERRLLPLEPIIERTIQPLRLAKSDYEYEVTVPPNLPEIEVDPVRFEQVIRNLLDNAFKDSSPGGKISIHAEQQGNEVVVSVRDQGKGIPPDLLPYLFDRSYQISQLSSGKSFDVGLGLYLCREIVAAHGGRIWVESEVGRGTIISVALPVNPVLSRPIITTSQMTAQTTSAERALWMPACGLIVEDDPPMLRLLELALQSEGYKTVAARRGEAALELAATQRLDFVLLDIQLPDLDGFQVCHRLREFTAVPVIMVTGRADERDRVRGLNVGADDYLVKPINQDELIARVRAVLRRTQAQNKLNGQPSAKFGDLTLDFAHRQVSLKGKDVALNPHEYHLLQQLASKPGRVFTHGQLLSEVWGPEYRDATQYLWVHISRLRRKLEDDRDEPRYIFTESGIGYRFCES